MIYGLYHSAAGMLASQYRQDVISNNLANVDTTAYKRDIASFSERLIEAQRRMGATRHDVFDHQTGGVWSAPTHTDWQAGPADVTGNPLDAAIAGPGFFAVQTPDGVRYTRDGAFTIAPGGELVMATGGWPVLDEAGMPVRVGTDARSVRLGADGRVVVDEQAVARLQVANVEKARKVGGNLVAADGEVTRTEAHLRVGAIESSNVEAMAEMAAMIEAARAYQLNAQMVTLQDGTLGRLINEVGRPAA